MIYLLFTLLFTFISLPALCMAQFPTISLWTDTFARADESPAAPPWISPMETGEVTCDVTSGALRRTGGSGFGSCYRNVAVDGSGGSIEVVASLPNADSHNPGNTFRLLFCLQGGLGGVDPDGYGISLIKRSAADDEWTLVRLNNGGYNAEGVDVFREFNSGDLIGAKWTTGGNLSMYHKPGASAWVEIATANDVTFDCSGNTFGGMQVAHGTMQMGDFAFGATVVPSPLKSWYRPVEFK